MYYVFSQGPSLTGESAGFSFISLHITEEEAFKKANEMRKSLESQADTRSAYRDWACKFVVMKRLAG